MSTSQRNIFANDPIRSSACISECGNYRYWLLRQWNERRPSLTWIMHNPSTADQANDDPTIRRCISFAKMWNFGGIVVVNLFAYRATDPKKLLKALDPIGPVCDKSIRQWTRNAMVICAWGIPCLMPRNREVYAMLVNGNSAIFCLGLTRDGHPKHPLYIPKKQEPMDFRPSFKGTP